MSTENTLLIQTHVASEDGPFCQLCGLPLPYPVEKGEETPITPGERIAVIENNAIPHSSYRPHPDLDSNQPCTP